MVDTINKSNKAFGTGNYDNAGPSNAVKLV